MTYLCIPLRGKRGGTVLVTESAWHLVDGYYWYLAKNGYAMSPKVGLMHRRLMAAEPGPSGEDVDHRNFNRLDNRYNNLACMPKGMNNRHRQKNNTPWPYKGVRRVGHRWQARMTVNQCGIYIGSYKTAEEAASAYDAAARKAFGHLAVCNFGESK